MGTLQKCDGWAGVHRDVEWCCRSEALCLQTSILFESLSHGLGILVFSVDLVKSLISTSFPRTSFCKCTAWHHTHERQISPILFWSKIWTTALWYKASFCTGVFVLTISFINLHRLRDHLSFSQNSRNWQYWYQSLYYLKTEKSKNKMLLQWALNLGPHPFGSDALLSELLLLRDLRSSYGHAILVLTK